MQGCYDMRIRWAIRRLREESTLNEWLLDHVLICLTHRGCVGSARIEVVAGRGIIGEGTPESVVGQSVRHLGRCGRV